MKKTNDVSLRIYLFVVCSYLSTTHLSLRFFLLFFFFFFNIFFFGGGGEYVASKLVNSNILCYILRDTKQAQDF